MPMIPQGAFAMLACTRIGAIHSVVFGGYAAKEFADRIDDLMPKLIITGTVGLEPGKEIVFSPIIDDALTYCKKLPNAKNLPRLVYQRSELNGKYRDSTLDNRTDVYFDY